MKRSEINIINEIKTKKIDRREEKKVVQK